MLLDYSLTFEFATDKPLTMKGTVEASNPATAAARAVRAAQDAYPKTRWQSIVVVLERIE
jgi:hypothetical protein